MKKREKKINEKKIVSVKEIPSEIKKVSPGENSEKDKSELEEELEEPIKNNFQNFLQPIEIPDTTLKPISNQPRVQVDEETESESLEEGVGEETVTQIPSNQQIRYLPSERTSEYIPAQTRERKTETEEGAEPPRIIPTESFSSSAGVPVFRRPIQKINFQDEARRINETMERDYEPQPEFDFTGEIFEERDGLPFEENRKYKKAFR